ncbi:hypothetical protein MNV49_007113 [Pseudohyphozyma bogoriensis]|nr:hypothetical protein MNV49_007113 [Pseudohyphozyma bogoriensis]
MPLKQRASSQKITKLSYGKDFEAWVELNGKRAKLYEVGDTGGEDPEQGKLCFSKIKNPRRGARSSSPAPKFEEVLSVQEETLKNAELYHTVRLGSPFEERGALDPHD